MGESTPALSPQEAASVIAQEQHYEEALTARTAGLVAMVWAIALPATIFSVIAFDPFLTRFGVIYSALMLLPFTIGGALISSLVARDRAIRLGQRSKPWLVWIGFPVGVAMFFFLAGVFSAFSALKPILGGHGIVAILAGSYLSVKGIWLLRQPWCRRPWAIFLGLGLMALGIILNVWRAQHGLPQDGVVLAIGLGVGLAWFVHGLLLYLRG